MFPYEFTNFNIIRGLVWLVVIDPLLMTIGYWILMLGLLPLLGLFLGANAFAHGRKNEKQQIPASDSKGSSDLDTGGAFSSTIIENHNGNATGPHAFMPAQIGALHMWMEGETGPGELHILANGDSLFRVTNGPDWNLGNLGETASDYRITAEGKVTVGFKPPLAILLWAETEKAPILVELLLQSDIPRLSEGELPPL